MYFFCGETPAYWIFFEDGVTMVRGCRFYGIIAGAALTLCPMPFSLCWNLPWKTGFLYAKRMIGPWYQCVGCAFPSTRQIFRWKIEDAVIARRETCKKETLWTTDLLSSYNMPTFLVFATSKRKTWPWWNVSSASRLRSWEDQYCHSHNNRGSVSGFSTVSQ